jgi:hypothetical protein
MNFPTTFVLFQRTWNQIFLPVGEWSSNDMKVPLLWWSGRVFWKWEDEHGENL